MRFKECFSLCLLLFSSLFINAQTLNFFSPEQSCLEEKVRLQNTSGQEFTEFEWDFCEGDLSLSPNLTTRSDSRFNIPVGTSLIKSNGKWYGFICSFSNELFRLDFGSSLFNAFPLISNLGNISSLLSLPQDIRVIEYNNSFYAFINNRGANEVVRVDLGTDIENSSPSAQIIVGGNGFTNGGIDIEFDGTNWVLGITNSFTIKLVKLGTIC